MINLHSLVRSTVNDHPDMADPGDLAKLVFDQIDTEDYADVIRTMLRGYVRSVINETRRLPELPVGHPSDETQGRSARRNQSIGRHVRAMQAGAWRQRLVDKYETPSGWKLLRDMTPGDLEYVAEYRRELANSNLIVAERLDGLRKLVEHHSAATVGDLPDAVLSEALDE